MADSLDATDEQKRIANASTDAASFQQLYDAYFLRIYAYTAYRVARREDAEDVVSEVFITMLEKLHQFRGGQTGAFAAWLFRICRNTITDFHRRTDRQPHTSSLDTVPELHTQSPSPDQAVIHAETRHELLQLVHTLAPRRQEVITLKFYGGLRNNEIAQVLGLDERTVASHLTRALRDLQQKYRKEVAE